MAKVMTGGKACTINPLRLSQPLGAALAFLGMDRCLPLMHGAQGCTSFGLVLLVRHFRETIPLQTTAMSEVTTILGGLENVREAILNIVNRAHPRIIGICTTGTTEVKGDDLTGFLTLIRQLHPELKLVELLDVSTPDFNGSFQDGWAKTVERIIESLVTESRMKVINSRHINVLPGSYLTPGDIEELRDIIDSFSLEPVFLPDLSGSLDGHVPDEYTPTTLGGTTLEQVRGMGNACHTIAIGEQMRGAAITLEHRTGVPYTLFDRLTGLECNDRLISLLSTLSGVPVPGRLRRQRGQLVDAMLDGHFFFGNKKVAIAAEPDQLFGYAAWMHEMGCEIVAAVTTAETPVVEKVPAETVVIGDLGDLEDRAAEAEILVTNSQGRQTAERLAIPHFRIGLPVHDRIGANHLVSVGYRGTRDLIFSVGNMFMAISHEPTPQTWMPLSNTEQECSGKCAPM